MHERRSFLQAAAGAGLATAVSYRKIRGANERVRVGFIGIGLIGRRHLLDFLAQPDVEVAGISEVYEPRLQEGLALSGGRATGHKDFRRMYERRDVDAVVVSTPDHWHALMTILACAAGKDVYVEKPLTHFVREGAWMLRTARHHRSVVQVGTQQRSGEHYRKCLELIRAGHIGEVRNVRVSAFRNITPGFTRPVGTENLSAADWQMWLGPAREVPFDPVRCIYHFRWFWDYSGGQTTNLLAHDLDIAQWVLGERPRAVTAFGGRYSLKGFGETPDVCEAVFSYPNFILNWSNSEVSTGPPVRGLEFYGTKGALRINRTGFEVSPDKMLTPESQIPQFGAAATATTLPAETVPSWRTTAQKAEGYEQVKDQFRPHVRNFLDCVKSRGTPVSDLASAAETANSCHLANIALKLNRAVRWDADRQEIMGDREAASMLTREYRAPWDRELRGALPASRRV